MFAHAVPKKGVDPKGYVTEQIRQDVLWLGHSQVTIRGDNEPALVQVIEAALAALKVVCSMVSHWQFFSIIIPSLWEG